MISVQQLGQLIPGPASAGVQCLDSNNNLDLARFGSRIYLAWRTAPNHFASPRARIEVSSTDEVGSTWRHEATYTLGADLREPRFVVDGDCLHLFFMELGTDPKRFQPRRTHRASMEGGIWGDPAVAVDDRVVPWRIRRLRDRWMLSTYRGSEKMYGPWPADPSIELRFSDDLIHWDPPIPVHEGGIECELVELAGGQLVGVTRNEGPSRFGSDVLVGTEIGDLSVRPRPFKLDSPNLFVWAGEPWLIARRSLGFSGRYSVAPRWLPGVVGIRANQLAWWVTRKRSSLFRVDPSVSDVIWQSDLPSRGDTSFAGVIVENDNSLLVADYSSPESSGDPIWVKGQLGKTVISWFRVTKNPVG